MATQRTIGMLYQVSASGVTPAVQPEPRPETQQERHDRELAAWLFGDDGRRKVRGSFGSAGQQPEVSMEAAREQQVHSVVGASSSSNSDAAFAALQVREMVERRAVRVQRAAVRQQFHRAIRQHHQGQFVGGLS